RDSTCHPTLLTIQRTAATDFATGSSPWRGCWREEKKSGWRHNEPRDRSKSKLLEPEPEPKLARAWQTGTGRNRRPHRARAAEAGRTVHAGEGLAAGRVHETAVGAQPESTRRSARRIGGQRREYTTESRRRQAARSNHVRHIRHVEHLGGEFELQAFPDLDQFRDLNILRYERIAES